jgi:hypothetical protein
MLTATMPTAPYPGMQLGPDTPLDDPQERALLRAEFDALIAASYRPAADAPHPRPPVRRVGTVAPTVAHATPAADVVDGRRLGGRRAPGEPSPRERSPPTPRR